MDAEDPHQTGILADDVLSLCFQEFKTVASWRAVHTVCRRWARVRAKTPITKWVVQFRDNVDAIVPRCGAVKDRLADVDILLLELVSQKKVHHLTI